MKKRFSAFLLAALMVAALLPAMSFAATTTVSTAAELKDALAAVQDGGTIKLTDDIQFTASNAHYTDGTWIDGVRYTGDKSFTIDLGGHTISENGEINDYLLYFTNNGAKANEITLINGTISGGDNLWNVICVSSQVAAYPTTLNLGNGLTVNAAGANNSGEDGAIKVRGISVLNVKSGSKVTSTDAMYCVQGGVFSNDSATLNIYDGAQIDQQFENGIAVSGTAIVNIYGGNIKSEGSGVFTCTSGTPNYTISGGTIEAPLAVVACSDQSLDPNAAPSVSIVGGEIKGAVQAIDYGTPAEGAGSKMSITGGTFQTVEGGAADWTALEQFVPEHCEIDTATGKVTDPTAVTVYAGPVMNWVKVNAANNGVVKSGPLAASAGATVTLYPKAAEGYVLDTVEVLDAEGNAVELDGLKFAIPAGGVTVNATFKLAE